MSDHEGDTGALFDDPEGYYPQTPPPTSQTYTLLTKPDETITLHLVGHSPLEAHHLWNGSRIVSNYLETHPDLVHNKSVLELGAGAGLPSLVAGVLGARKVVMTDFPDADLIATMQKNIDLCSQLSYIKNSLSPSAAAAQEGRFEHTENELEWKEREARCPVVTRGYIWGADPTPLLEIIRSESSNGFDVLILADLLFRHSEHGHLLDTISSAMKKAPDAKALVFFTSYRPWLQHKDLAFFDLARERGLVVDKLLEEKLEKPLFENDPGDVEIQKTVMGWVVRWP